MNHDTSDGASGIEGSDQNLPAAEPGSRHVPAARQPMEQIARAMQAQAELMKAMHERQRALEDVVKDTRRHELVINSAQALNESFQGLQRVQERLADKLGEGGDKSRARFIVIAVGLVALVAVGGVLVWRINDNTETLGTTVKAALDPRVRDEQQRARDQETAATLEKIEGRVKGVEEAHRAAFQDEITKLRKGLTAIEAERDMLRKDRDAAREELGVAKASLASTQTEAAEAKKKLTGLEADNARLTAESLANQSMVKQLNDRIASLQAAPPTAKTAQQDTDAPKKPAPPPETATAGSERAATPPAPSAAAPDRTAAAKNEAEPPAAGTDSPVALPPAQVEAINELLKSHNGSDRYDLKKAEKVGQGKLWTVGMEVSGADGRITKSIEAESLSFSVTDKYVEMIFEGGSVTFHQGTKFGKVPFFNNRYVIVVLATNVKDWTASTLSYVKMK